MLALRLARIATRPARRCLATATANHAEVALEASSSPSEPTVTTSSVAPVPLSNVEAPYTKLNGDENLVHVSRDGAGPARGIRCFRCGKNGHVSRECPESKACYTCGNVGHLARDCPKGIKCYNCSGTGHISSDCPQPKNRSCYTCGSEGHISRDCPNRVVEATND